MWSGTRKLLIILLVIFALVNVALFTYFFISSKKPPSQKESPSQTVNPDQSNSNIGIFSVRKGDLRQIILGGLTIYGYVESVPKKDTKGNETLILSIPLKNGVIFKSEVVLGKNEDKISHTIIKRDAVDDKATWTFETVNNLRPQFAVGRPVTLELVYQQSTEGLGQNCNEECRQWVVDRVFLFENNLRLLKALEESTPLEKVIQVGPVQTAIFYVN